MHFDIRLKPADSGISGMKVDHRIRQTVRHPEPSLGYRPVFGDVPEIPLSPGFSVSKMDYMLPRPAAYSFKSTSSPILFAYTLSGWRSFRFKNDSREVVTKAGTWYVGYIPESDGMGIIKGMPELRSVKLRFDPLALYELLEGRVRELPQKFALLLSRLEGDTMTIGGPMSAAMVTAAEQVLQCPCTNTVQQLRFESIVLDLLALHLKELSDSRTGRTGDRCSSKEIALAGQAREMVMATLENPPGLSRLTAKLGVNAFALKSTFSRVYGVSLHQYIHTRRMETARQWIEQGEMNVNEVAQKTGYANTSRFIAAFFRTYGATPGGYMKRTRQVYPVS